MVLVAIISYIFSVTKPAMTTDGIFIRLPGAFVFSGARSLLRWYLALPRPAPLSVRQCPHFKRKPSIPGLTLRLTVPQSYQMIWVGSSSSSGSPDRVPWQCCSRVLRMASLNLLIQSIDIFVLWLFLIRQFISEAWPTNWKISAYCSL